MAPAKLEGWRQPGSERTACKVCNVDRPELKARAVTPGAREPGQQRALCQFRSIWGLCAANAQTASQARRQEHDENAPLFFARSSAASVLSGLRLYTEMENPFSAMLRAKFCAARVAQAGRPNRRGRATLAAAPTLSRNSVDRDARAAPDPSPRGLQGQPWRPRPCCTRAGDVRQTVREGADATRVQELSRCLDAPDTPMLLACEQVVPSSDAWRGVRARPAKRLDCRSAPRRKSGHWEWPALFRRVDGRAANL